MKYIGTEMTYYYESEDGITHYRRCGGVWEQLLCGRWEIVYNGALVKALEESFEDLNT